ncbi:MAG TPA: Ig-like domain-containing protein [Gemmatimonadales bacterium]
MVRSLAAVLALGAPGILVAQNVTEVQVAPPSVSLRVGERTGLLATAFDRIGNVIPTARFSWSSNNVNVARVDNSGTVTGVGGGIAIIEARVGSRSGQAAVQVVGAPVSGPQQNTPPPPSGNDPLAGQPAGTGPAAALRMEPSTILLLPSENTRISPRALKADGSPAAPVRVNWQSLRADIASVDQSGNVVALAAGQGVIQATAAGGLTATAPVVVQLVDVAIRAASPYTLSPGQTDTLVVVVPQQNLRRVNPLQLQWASSDATVARVSLTGVVTAVAPGRATIAVRGLLQQANVELTVHRPVTGLEVRPPRSADVLVPHTGRQKFEANALAEDNTPVRDAPLRWAVADTTIASFDPATGMLLGKSPGKTQLTVRGPGSGLAVTWNVTVVSGVVRLASRRFGIAVGERYTLRATYVDENGAVLVPAVGGTWASDRPDVAAVAEDGTVTGTGYGRARVTVTAPGGSSDTADVFTQGEILVASTRGGRYQLYAIERSNLAQLRRITDDTATAMEPAYSADASRIAYVSQRDGNPEIYVMDADGRGPGRLTNERQADGHPVFTPDGQTIVFHSSRTRNQQIFSVGVDGANVRQLTQEPGANMQPAVSPDGNTIAFVSGREGSNDIWLMARDGTQQRGFTRSREWRESYPRFLRDGSLAYLVERREGNRTVTQVMKADLATGQTTALSGTDLFITAFAVSPAGDLLALVVPVPGTERRRNPTYRVYIQPVGAGAPVPIPGAGEEQIATPAFQP